MNSVTKVVYHPLIPPIPTLTAMSMPLLRRDRQTVSASAWSVGIGDIMKEEIKVQLENSCR